MSAARVLAPELVWTGARFERGVRVALGDDGRIAAVGPDAGPGAPAEDLPRRALLPGFVSAHSHAFQRGLRGRGETFPAGAGDFWTWREAMYGLVGALDAEGLRALSLAAFREMLRAGITAVGEFHYLHHASDDDDFALDAAVVDAAAEAGIRLVLLQAYYATGDVGRPLEGAQRRFRTADPGRYWASVDALAERLDPRTQAVGAVVHSVRAASLEDLAAVHAEAERRRLPFHAHLEEQPREIEACRAAYGATPMALVCERLAVSERFTAVHCTHTDPADLERFLAAGGTVCVCPLTEANLGDGVPRLPERLAADGRVALGTDSNARISLLEEMRWLEYGQRLTRGRRGVLADAEGTVARPLLRAATEGGARALGLDAGRIAPGALADLVAVDLDAPTLAGADDETLLAALVLGAGEEALAGTWVGGRRVVG